MDSTKIIVFQDSTVKINVSQVIKGINRRVSFLNISSGKGKLQINADEVSSPSTHNVIRKQLTKDTKKADILILFTNKKYDNNYFWEADGNIIIVSLYGWKWLTKLSRNNGAAYLICDILMDLYSLGSTHSDNTGCINDFMQDKTSIDTGMRCSFVCANCSSRLSKKQNKILNDIKKILDDICLSSRQGMDICEYWDLGTKRLFDAFICYNSQDKTRITKLKNRLKKAGIKTWFDEDQLPPGRTWQNILEEQISSIRTAVVFVGQNGIGPWQRLEVKAFLQEFVGRGCPVIPVILPNCKQVPELPIFLRQMTWVDFRKKKPNPFEHLLWGVTGKKTLRK